MLKQITFTDLKKGKKSEEKVDIFAERANIHSYKKRESLGI